MGLLKFFLGFVCLDMSLKMACMNKAGGTVWTRIWAFSCMGADVNFKITFKSSTERTVWACVRFLSCVRTNVILQISATSTAKGTERTDIGLFTSVSPDVATHCVQAVGEIGAVRTLVGLD